MHECHYRSIHEQCVEYNIRHVGRGSVRIQDRNFHSLLISDYKTIIRIAAQVFRA